MKWVVICVLLAVFCMAATSSAPPPDTEIFDVVTVKWNAANGGVFQDFTATDGSHNITYYMLGDCLTIKDLTNGRTWTFRGVWDYVDAKNN